MQKILLLIATIGTWNALGQTASRPPANEFYRTDVVPRIDITIPADSLAAIFANVTSDYEYHARFAYTAPGTSLSNIEVGFRLRGNTSRYSAKKSFKISFNSFTSGTRYYGVKDLNLNGEHNDPSIMRARIAWELAQDAGLPAPRVNHVRLYINGQAYGLYANVEHYNDDYVTHRYARDPGNLYKCLYPADLAYLGADPNAYKLTAQGRRVYELKTNEAADDYSGLARFIGALNATTSTQSLCALDSVFDVNGYLKWLAWEITVGHWDNHSFNKNNFYLYEEPASGLMHFISYDADNTFGVDWFNIDWSTRNMFQYGSYALYTKITSNPEARRRLKLFMQALAPIAGTAAWRERNEGIRAQLLPYLGADPYRSLDYGYDSLAFWNSLETAAGAHVKSGIHPFMTARLAANANQFPAGNAEPVVFPPRINGRGGRGRIPIQVEVWDEGQTQVVFWYRQSGSATWQSLNLYDDGMHHDGDAGDRVFGGLLPALPHGFWYYAAATDDQQATRNAPCSPKFWATTSLPNILLNEACSLNQSGPTAPNGNREDWVELYNPGDSAYSLQGLYLTDSKTNHTKANLQNYTIPAGGRLLLWAEGGTGFSGAIPFKLSQNGDRIRLNGQYQGLWVAQDEVRLPPLMGDQSFGRRHDGFHTYAVFDQNPTPNASNAGTLWSPEYGALPKFRAYPIPFRDELTLENSSEQELVVEAFDVLGRLVDRIILAPNSQTVWPDFGPSGLRVLRCNGQTMRALKL